MSQMSAKASYDTVSEASQKTNESQADSVKTVPVQITASSGFAWAKRRKQEARMTRLGYRTSRSHNLGTNLGTLGLSGSIHPQDTLDAVVQECDDIPGKVRSYIKGPEENTKHVTFKQQEILLHRQDSFDPPDAYKPQELSTVSHISLLSSTNGATTPVYVATLDRFNFINYVTLHLSEYIIY